MRFSILKLLGSRRAKSPYDVVLGFNSPEGDLELHLNPDILMPLALEVMNARSTWEREQPTSDKNEFHALVTDRWEIRRSDQKAAVLLSLKVTGGAWMRFEISREAIAAMHRTIEVAEGRQPPIPTPSQKN